MNENLQTAFELRKKQDYPAAIKIYEILWSQNQDAFSDWDGWSYSFSLSKLNRHEEALQICRLLFPRYRNSTIIKSHYAKCIYHSVFAHQSISTIPIMRKAVDAIFKLDPPHQNYSISSIAIMKWVKNLMKQTEINWQEIEDWLLRLDPDLLNENPYKVDKNGKKIEIASLKEDWYNTMIRAKAGLHQPQALLDLLSMARKQNFKWHYANEIWLARKEAFAYHALSQNKKAENILRRLITQKKDWFLLYDLAMIVDDNEESLSLFCRAAIMPSKNELKLKLYNSLYEHLLEHTHFEKEAVLHLELLASIRTKNDWPLSEKFKNQMSKHALSVAETRTENQIINELVPFWEKLTGLKTVRLEGVVEKILPHQKSGFIRTDEHTYYFETGKLMGKISEGSKLSFLLREGFDKKKNKPSHIAIDIKLI